MRVDFSPTAIDENGIIPREAVVGLSPDEPLELLDARTNVLGLRFQLDEDAYEESRILLEVPDELLFRMILVHKDDEMYGKRGTFRNDVSADYTAWNLFIPVSDRFEYTPESVRFVNRTVLALMRVCAHARKIDLQYSGNAQLMQAAFQVQFDIINYDAYEYSKQVVDGIAPVLVPSDSPAEIEKPLSEGEKDGTAE